MKLASAIDPVQPVHASEENSLEGGAVAFACLPYWPYWVGYDSFALRMSLSTPVHRDESTLR